MSVNSSNADVIYENYPCSICAEKLHSHLVNGGLKILLSYGTWIKIQVAEGDSFKQTPADRNLAILRYLRKWDGDWKNKNEISFNQRR